MPQDERSKNQPSSSPRVEGIDEILKEAEARFDEEGRLQAGQAGSGEEATRPDIRVEDLQQEDLAQEDDSPDATNHLEEGPTVIEDSPPIDENNHSTPPPAGEEESASLRQALEQKEKEYRELYDQFLRLSAEFDNYRKRAAREKAEVLRFGHEKPVKELLPVLDNFERALSTLDEEKAEVSSIREGLQMLHRQFLDALERHGVKRLELSPGEPFDYTYHEAISLFETEDYPPNTIFQIYQPGYLIHERLLRPAVVVVAKAPAPAPEEKASSPKEAQVAQEGAAAEPPEGEGPQGGPSNGIEDQGTREE